MWLDLGHLIRWSGEWFWFLIPFFQQSSHYRVIWCIFQPELWTLARDLSGGIGLSNWLVWFDMITYARVLQKGWLDGLLRVSCLKFQKCWGPKRSIGITALQSLLAILLFNRLPWSGHLAAPWLFNTTIPHLYRFHVWDTPLSSFITPSWPRKAHFAPAETC